MMSAKGGAYMTVKLNSKFVKYALVDRDMSARDLAAKAGISEGTMYRMMNGAVFNSDTLGKLAEALGCHPVDLIEGEGFASPHMDAPPVGMAA
jgi:DNA-binding Xre family transcriptional regulator